MHRLTLLLVLAAAAAGQPARPATPTAATPDAAVGQVNTLWVIPQENLAWVERLYAKRRPGGALYTVDGYVAQHDLAQSLAAAINWLAKHPEDAPGFNRLWKSHDLYFTWPDPDQPRGGPSAGVAFAVAAYSAMLELPVRRDAAFTGGISPEGRVLGVGGLALKIPATIAAGMRTLCLPAASAPALDTLPYSVISRLRVVALTRAEEAFYEAFGLNGPEADRYDRMLTLYQDARLAMAKREGVKARLALDELVELVPNDLTAARLRSFYQNQDMRQVAPSLYADAERYERDGLPDEALKAARRAAGYADQATREQHRELLERLERSSLPADRRVLLDRARELARRGDIGEAWRLLKELRAREPRHPYLQQVEAQWQKYGAVALLEDTLRRNPEDNVTRAALAKAYLEARAPQRSADMYAELRVREPEQVGWPVAEARALAAATQIESAAQRLRAARPKWPRQIDAVAGELGLDLEPPLLQVSDIALDGLRLTAAVRSDDAAGPPHLALWLGSRPDATVTGTAATLYLDLGRLPAGPSRVRLVSRDRFANEAVYQLELSPTARDEGPCLRSLPVPKTATAGLVALSPERPLVVAPATTLVVDGPAWFAAAGPVSQVTAKGVTAKAAPYRLELPALPAGDHVVEVQATLRDGGQPPARSVAVRVAEQPPAWIAAPAADAVVNGTVPVVIGRTAEGPAPVVLLVDGQPRWRADGKAPLWLDPQRLVPGAHRLQAMVEDGPRWLVTPPVTITVASGRAIPAGKGDDGAPLLPPPAGVAALNVTAAVTDPALRVEAGREAACLLPDPPPYRAGSAVSPPDTPLRVDDGPLPQPRTLVIGAGDALAFAEVRDRDSLGPSAALKPGLLATTVWTPTAPGTYRIDLRDGAAMVTATEQPPLMLLGLPSGAHLSGTVRLEAVLPELPELGAVTLVDRERPLATWPSSVTRFSLDGGKLEAGVHVLRLVGLLRDGTRLVSPPLVLETG